MKEVKINAYTTEGYAVTVEIEAKEYAENFLHIFNNVRANNDLIKVRNYYNDNDVTVYCKAEARDNLVNYLKAFGKIKGHEKVLIYQMEEPDYDIDKYYDIVAAMDFD